MKKLLLIPVSAFVFSLLAGAPLSEEKALNSIPSLKWRSAVAVPEKGTMKAPAGGATIRLTYPIVYNASGQPAKTSWPRCNVAFPPDSLDWSRYDFLEFQVYTAFNRSDEEYLPVTASFSGGKGKGVLHAYDIRTLRQNQWVKISLPLRNMRTRNSVRTMQIHLNARRYFPNDKLVLHLGDFKLVRLTQWQTAAFRMTAPAIFSDRTSLPVEFELLGPGEEFAVPFRISAKDGRKVRDLKLLCKRGFDYRTLEIGALPPGDYTLTVFPGDAARTNSASFKVVPSPWKK